MAINYPKLYNSKKDIMGLGLGVLRDTISCIVTEERNGIFELEMTYKADGFLADELHIGKIIKANASKSLRNQLFRIYNTKRTLDGNITILAEHIFFDLRKSFVPRVDLGKPISANTAITNVLQSSSTPTDYTVSSDITTEHKVLYEFKSALECIVGSTGSIVDTWNGDLLRDNNNIKYLNNRGQDRGVHITYTKNMTGLEAIEDLDSVVTAIYPYVLLPKEANTENYDGETVTGEESVYLTNDIVTVEGGYVYADNYKDFDTMFCQGIDFSNDDFWNTYAVNPINLEILTKRYISSSKCNIPSSTYEVDLIALSSTEEYKNFSFMEDIDLCDTVLVNNKKYGIKDKVKVTELKFNTLTDKIESLKLGGTTTSLSSQLNSQLDAIKDAINSNKTETEKVIEYVTQQITGCDGGYVKLFPPHNPQEIFILNNEDPMKATEVLRINKAGIGFGSSINGPFKTGWTASGVFNADFIRAGSLSANLIRSGVLSNASGTIQINLESNTIDFYSKMEGILKRGISIYGPVINFFDWQGNNEYSGAVTISRQVFSDGQTGTYPIMALNHEENAFTNIGYRKNDGTNYISPYITFDVYNRKERATDHAPIMLHEPTLFHEYAITRRGIKLKTDEEEILYRTSAGATALQLSKGDGFLLVNEERKPIIWIKPESTAIKLMNNYHFESVYIDDKYNGMYLSNDDTIVIKGDKQVSIVAGGYKTFDFENGSNLTYFDINMNGNSLINSGVKNTYSDSNTKRFFNTYSTQSLQEEVSYTFESITKGKEVKIYLNKNIECITKNDYIVQLTPYENCRIWCKKYDDYFMVYTDVDDVEFSCRVIKKLIENNTKNYAKINNKVNDVVNNKAEEVTNYATKENFAYRIQE